jgi:hypothetical protein
VFTRQARGGQTWCPPSPSLLIAVLRDDGPGADPLADPSPGAQSRSRCVPSSGERRLATRPLVAFPGLFRILPEKVPKKKSPSFRAKRPQMTFLSLISHITGSVPARWLVPRLGCPRNSRIHEPVDGWPAWPVRVIQRPVSVVLSGQVRGASVWIGPARASPVERLRRPLTGGRYAPTDSGGLWDGRQGSIRGQYEA